MTAAYFEDHPTDPEKVILRKPPQELVQFKCTVIDDAHPDGVPLEKWGKSPQRTWVGLTREVEAKLKEKNA